MSINYETPGQFYQHLCERFIYFTFFKTLPQRNWMTFFFIILSFTLVNHINREKVVVKIPGRNDTKTLHIFCVKVTSTFGVKIFYFSILELGFEETVLLILHKTDIRRKLNLNVIKGDCYCCWSSRGNSTLRTIWNVHTYVYLHVKTYILYASVYQCNLKIS